LTVKLCDEATKIVKFYPQEASRDDEEVKLDDMYLFSAYFFSHSYFENENVSPPLVSSLLLLPLSNPQIARQVVSD
jgi:hypothetical protein